MGDTFSHAHAACLACQLPKGARCLAVEDPHEEWDAATWMLWHIEREISMLRWGFVKYEGEEQPEPLPYPGRDVDRISRVMRFEASKDAVDAAFGMSGGE